MLLCALCATVIAIFYPVEQEEAPISRARVKKAPIRVALAPIDRAVHEWAPLGSDPFAPRNWIMAPPAPTTPVASQEVATVVTSSEPAAPAGPPALPFQFVGKMSDNGDQIIYLSKGEQALLARPGVTLEGTYKVIDISAVQIEFEHLPTGQKQVLVFPTPNN